SLPFTRQSGPLLESTIRERVTQIVPSLSSVILLILPRSGKTVRVPPFQRANASPVPIHKLSSRLPKRETISETCNALPGGAAQRQNLAPSNRISPASVPIHR